jgi:hypothetical protein
MDMFYSFVDAGYSLLVFLSSPCSRVMDLAFSLGFITNIFLAFQSWFHACAYLEQFAMYILLLGSHGLSLDLGVYNSCDL